MNFASVHCRSEEILVMWPVAISRLSRIHANVNRRKLLQMGVSGLYVFQN